MCRGKYSERKLETKLVIEWHYRWHELKSAGTGEVYMQIVPKGGGVVSRLLALPDSGKSAAFAIQHGRYVKVWENNNETRKHKTPACAHQKHNIHWKKLCMVVNNKATMFSIHLELFL